MPYEYWSMSAEERAEALRRRRALHFPLHAPPHPFRDRVSYLLTASTYRHMPVIEPASRRTDFERRLLDGMRGVGARVFGWAVLPNHYHILVAIASLDCASAVIKSLHGSTSREWNLADGLTGSRRVWYHYVDRVIRNEGQLCQALNYIYIHINPVKHGHTEDLYAWPWSSLSAYVEEQGRDWLQQNWRLHPPVDFGKGWDD